MHRAAEPSTRDRLIAAAGELFGEKGFHATSIREICAKAGANVASVNYHFTDKLKLSEEVLVHIFDFGSDRRPVEETANPEWPPERQLHAFIHRFLLTRLDPARPAWHEQMIFREMVDAGPGMNAVVDRVIRRNAAVLFCILRRLLGETAPRRFVERCQHSVIAQCIHFVYHRSIVERVHPGLIDATPAGIDALAGHIAAFSLAAIEHLAVPDGDEPVRDGGA